MAESPAIRGKTADESPRSSRSFPPVTPGVNAGGISAYHDNDSETGGSPAAIRKKDQGPSETASSYFEASRSESPTHVAAGARDGQELLRRLSLPRPPVPAASTTQSLDPRDMHPSLGLTGNIISATFVVPYYIKHVSESEWVRAESKTLCSQSTDRNRTFNLAVAPLPCSTRFPISLPRNPAGIILYWDGLAKSTKKTSSVLKFPRKPWQNQLLF
jgi:hypothetical protein